MIVEGEGLKMKKMIKLEHHLDDYECMWNGIEDLYMRDTGEMLPPSFFFVLASFGSFCYLKTNKAELKRMVALGDGRTRQMYEFLAPIVGFDYKHYEHKIFEKALKRAKSEIDTGYPCVLGALDMCYLPYYPKLYHGDHIPFHYVLMVGYDDDLQNIYLYDCGRSEIQTLSYDKLKLAWGCSYQGLSKPNTVCTIRMHSTKNIYEIAKDALAIKAEQYLNPPVGFIGYRGMEKFIKELPEWKKELTKTDYDKILANMVEFLGAVPTVPNALRGIDEPDEIAFGGGFDKASVVLAQLGQKYTDQNLVDASTIFGTGALVIEQIKNIIVDYLVGKNDLTQMLPDLFADINRILKEGFETL
jgi:hypothetical protein